MPDRLHRWERRGLAGHQRRRRFIIHEAGNGQSIIRGNYKLVRPKNSSLKLFDLEADHTEANDIVQYIKKRFYHIFSKALNGLISI